MRTLEEIKRTVETGLGRFPCELKLANVQLVNVFSGEIYPTDIYIQNKRVVSIEPGLTLEAEKNVDCGGAYAVPGFIDSHMHFESTMLSPEALATVVVPQGTTTLCADLMEIANVAGEEGLRTMLTCMDRLPYGARYRPDRRADHQSRSDPHASGEAGGNPARSVAGYFEAGRCGALRKDRRCGRGLCAGLYAEKSALAYSMSHDHHNIVTVGVSDSDMAIAVNEVARLHDGLTVVCDGNVMDSMCLPIGGLMSECGADEVMRLLDGMNEAVRQLGCQMPAPFMTLSFISLPTVPDLGLTDMGLVDVLGHRLIDVETQDND